MKLDNISIKWKLSFYLVAFALVMLALLWFLQIEFLDDFYKYQKTKNIRSSAENIEKNINNSNIQTLIDTISIQREICIRIVDKENKDLFTSEDIIPDCIIHKIPPTEIEGYYQRAVNSGGTFVDITSKENIKDKLYDERHFIGNVPTANNRVRGQSLIYIKLIEMNNNTKVMLMLNSAITPVNTTVETLRAQLIFVTAIMLLLSVSLALFMSRRISKPIIKINNSAKILAKGNYDIAFDGKGYLEISELRETLNYAAKELSKTENLRRELIANISHDLRTPLTLITGYGEVMRDIPGENTPENVQIIIDEARRLASLVNDILDISKLQAGTQELSILEFNLSQSICDILNRYSKLTEQDGYKIKFIHDVDVFVKADEMKISQVIYNLINNAITYTGEDKTVTVCQKINEGYAKIEIIDTGKGISADKLSLIWDRYYKIDKTHKRAAIGSGLGLSIVQGILKMHDAKFGVDSSPGRGSTFWFELKIR